MNAPLTDLLDDSAAESWHVMPRRERATFAGQPVDADRMAKVRRVVVYEDAIAADWQREWDDE